MPSSSKKTAKNRKASVAGARRGARDAGTKTARTAASAETPAKKAASATTTKTKKTAAAATSAKSSSPKSSSAKSASAKSRAAAAAGKTTARTAAGETAAARTRAAAKTAAQASAARSGASKSAATRSGKTTKAAGAETIVAKSAVGKSAVAKAAATKAIVAKSAATKSAATKSAVAKAAIAEAAVVAKAVIAKAAIAKAVEGKTPARARASAARSSDAKRSATERHVESAASEPVAVVEAPATPPHAEKISAPTSAIEKRVETARQEMGEKDIRREKEIGQQSGREHSPEISHQTSTAVAAAGVTGETRITTTSRESAPHIDIEHSDASSPSVAPIAGASEPNAAASVSPPASSETIPVPKQTQGKAINAKSSPAPTAPMSAAASSALSPKAIVAARTAAAAPIKQPIPPAVKAKTSAHKLGFKTHEFVVYPAHGVGQIVAIETQEVAGFSLELFVVSFIKDKMTLKVPTSKVATVGMRKLAETEVVDKALSTLTGRARVKRTMWSRRAQEYEAKINSGDLVTIAEVVRDLYRSDTQPEQSYSERQLYEAALDRMAREVAAVRKLLDSESLKLIESFLQKGPRRGGPKGDAEADASDDASEEGEEDDVEERAA
ncbi:hypothetical+protein [Methylocapsa aurea]|uniref:CarD family transcriptional regulator n=1 Tax=Methylocapsa aurea TaxID=663610 RepID=UPI003D18DBE5